MTSAAWTSSSEALLVPHRGSSNVPNRPAEKGIDATRAGHWREGGLTATEIWLARPSRAAEMTRNGYQLVQVRPSLGPLLLLRRVAARQFGRRTRPERARDGEPGPGGPAQAQASTSGGDRMHRIRVGCTIRASVYDAADDPIGRPVRPRAVRSRRRSSPSSTPGSDMPTSAAGCAPWPGRSCRPSRSPPAPGSS